MAKIQNLFGGIQGNKSFYESELLRKVLQTLRGKISLKHQFCG